MRERSREKWARETAGCFLICLGFYAVIGQPAAPLLWMALAFCFATTVLIRD